MAQDFLAYFNTNGVPTTGLSPTVAIRRVDTGAEVVTAGAMSELGDGWYKYAYAAGSDSLEYVATADGGASLPTASRYASGATDSEPLATIAQDIDFLKQFMSGNWEIVNNQMIFYDSDGVTALRTYDLFNKLGVAAETDTYKREKV